MANKRMFSRDVVDGSRFIMLPHSAQNLYFHLGMHADDDGYCEYVSVIRLIAGSNSDLRILQENGFICVYNLYTLCIQDWYTHNKIPPSRYSESKYIKTFPERDLPIESQYNPLLEPCIQSVYKVYEEDSIEKGSIGKVRKDKNTVEQPRKKRASLDGVIDEIMREWIELSGQKKIQLTTEAFRSQIRGRIKDLKQEGKDNGLIREAFTFVFNNKKAQAEDDSYERFTVHDWNLTTLTRPKNFMKYLVEPDHKSNEDLGYDPNNFKGDCSGRQINDN